METRRTVVIEAYGREGGFGAADPVASVFALGDGDAGLVSNPSPS
jgi:hypothetical protein